MADHRKGINWRREEGDQRIERLQKELAGVQKYKKKTYENYVGGVLDKEEYLSYKAEYENRIRISEKKSGRQNKKKTALEKLRNSMKTGLKNL